MISLQSAPPSQVGGRFWKDFLEHYQVLPANITDREGSQQLLQELRQNQPQMKLHLLADGGYKGK